VPRPLLKPYLPIAKIGGKNQPNFTSVLAWQNSIGNSRWDGQTEVAQKRAIEIYHSKHTIPASDHLRSPQGWGLPHRFRALGSSAVSGTPTPCIPLFAAAVSPIPSACRIHHAPEPGREPCGGTRPLGYPAQAPDETAPLPQQQPSSSCSQAVRPPPPSQESRMPVGPVASLFLLRPAPRSPRPLPLPLRPRAVPPPPPSHLAPLLHPLPGPKELLTGVR
jgi:hypothetical protein